MLNGRDAMALAVLAVVAAVAAPAALGAPTIGVPRADCGPGSRPEPALQGEVTKADRENGRSAKPYACNLEVVGNYPGEGADYQDAWYGHCAYYDTKFQGGQNSPGVQVLDVTDPQHPRLSTTLTSPAMLDPWESLKVNEKRGLLAGVAAYSGSGPLFFDVYDVKADCAHPALLSSTPLDAPYGHEGNWAPDGKTYYATALFGGTVTAIDVSDPTLPTPITAFQVSSIVHGVSASDDGNRLYVADIAGQNSQSNGLTIMDVSAIQKRSLAPQVSVVGSVGYGEGGFAQHTIPVTIDGTRYIVFADEGGDAATRLIDISDDKHPRVVSVMKLEIQLPANQAEHDKTVGSGFGYNAHYCGVPREVDPEVVACSYFESGVRVFDIRDPVHPREIAYFNPGGDGIARPGSERSGGTSGYTSAQVRFVKTRDGGAQLWFTDQDRGFYVVRFTNDAWPFARSGSAAGGVAGAQTGAPQDLGLPPARVCASRRSFEIRLRAPRRDRLRSARVYVNGKRVQVLSGRRLRAPVNLRGLPRGTVHVKIIGRTRRGSLVRRTRTYRTCAANRTRRAR